MENILADGKHWIGWFISSALITTAIVVVMHLLQKHCIHTPFWVVLIVFAVVFAVEVIVDVIKHLIKLQ